MKSNRDAFRLRQFAARLCSAALLAAVAACGGGVDAPAPAPTPAPAPALAGADVAVTVVDTLGRFVEGATITVASTNASAKTDAHGKATLKVPVGGEQVLSLAKTGFAEQVQVVNLAIHATNGALRTMLIAREPAQTIATIEAGGNVVGKHGVKITLPAAALVNAAGQPVSGAVQFALTPVDVADLDVGAFPGRFEGTATGGVRSPIVSFGTAELMPTQGGQKLNLAAGKTAEVELPLYANRHQDGTPVKAGDRIPLWSLDVASGLWRQEGEGTVVVSSAAPTGFVLRATISHFSWWNVDAVSGRGFVNLTVNVLGTTLTAGTSAEVEGSVVAGTGPSSSATITVTVGEARQLQVPASSTTRLSARLELATQVCAGSVNVSPPRDTTVDATINATCVDVPLPRITRPAALLTSNSSRDVSLLIEIDGPQPDSVEVFADDTSIALMPTQFFYRPFWNTSTFAEGAYALTARATRQGVSGTSAPVTVVVDRTAPQMTAFAPSAATEVDRDTTFTVEFGEPVNPLPFTLTDAVRLSVVPLGQSARVNVAIDATLDAAGQLLTVRPTGTMPFGVASLTWGALRDAAENPVAGTITASWNVSRSARLGSDLARDLFSSFSLATDAGGLPHVLLRLPNGTDLQALRFDGTEFVPIGPLVNERPAGVNASLAIDGSGEVLVALEQRAAVGADVEVVVRRYDSTSNTWQTVVAPFAVGRPFGSSGPPTPQLAIDAANRPVLVLAGGPSFTLEGHRFDGNAWNALGTFRSNVFGSIAMRLNAAGNPVVAMSGGFVGSGEQLEVAEHNGTSWVQLGAALDSAPNSNVRLGPPQIAIAPDGRPWVAWHKSGGDVSLARFDGTAFVAMPVAPALLTYNGVAGLAFVNGDPVVAGGHQFNGGQVDVRRLRNGAWEPQSLLGMPGRASAVTLAASGNSVLIGAPTQFGNDGLARVSRLLFP